MNSSSFKYQKAVVFTFTILIVSCYFNIYAQEKPFPLIPYPASLVKGNGSFVISGSTPLIVSAEFKSEALLFQDMLFQGIGQKLTEAKTPGKAASIQLKYNASIKAEDGYRLEITSSSIVLSAGKPAGMFRGIETLRQLLPVSIEAKGKEVKQLSLPALTISDEPAYAWRGMHFDVSRHFFTVEYLKKFIDRMALYKFNKLHLHLTDDQGWRIEIKKYPKLTSEGAWRELNNQDSACMKNAVENPDFALDKRHLIQRGGKTLYGGFYTQQQMKDVINYATLRHIEIIPEIDMPGHMMAAIKAYPFLTCSGKVGWGKDFSIPICPCNESTYEFAENVFSEIIALFPSQYIHIGGDEVEKTSWAASDGCKDLMQKEGLKDVHELQSYFIRRMERFFNSKGKKLIGWDEILDGGVTSTAIVMYWRSWVTDAPAKAAKNKNKLIMSPVSNLYFDALPDKHTVYNVYHLNLIPKGLTTAEEANIMGGQANTWTEMIPSEDRFDYMTMPRMTALSEVLWTKKNLYPDYLKRLNSHYKRLDVMGVHYRLPDFEGVVEQNVFIDYAMLDVQKPLSDMQLRYTTDGSIPQISSKLLNSPLRIDTPQTIRLAAFNDNGSRGDVFTMRYQQKTFQEAVLRSDVRPGLRYEYYAKSFAATTKIVNIIPDLELEVKDLIVPASADAPAFGVKFRGYLDIPQTGIYSFFLTADDGAVLRIGGNEVVNNDGQHFAIEKSGQAALKKGLQIFELDFIEGGGGYKLNLSYSLNGSAPAEVPANWFRH